jgi:hypothetical protein
MLFSRLLGAAMVLSGASPDLNRDLYRTLWLSIIGTPLLFLWVLTINYMLITPACMASRWILFPANAVAVVATVFALSFALRTWRNAGGGTTAEEADVESRACFTGMVGLLVSGFILIQLIAHALPILIFDACLGQG